MSKKPCYTCKDSFIDRKKAILLENKQEEAKEYAKKNNYTGALAIVRMADADGYKIVRANDQQPQDKAVTYILFDKGEIL